MYIDTLINELTKHARNVRKVTLSRTEIPGISKSVAGARDLKSWNRKGLHDAADIS